MVKKINILGVEYTIKFDYSGMLPDSDGYIDQSVKEIYIAEPKSNVDSLKDLEMYKKQILRHEIIHAFLYESGLWANCTSVVSWGMSEEITDWIAL